MMRIYAPGPVFMGEVDAKDPAQAWRACVTGDHPDIGPGWIVADDQGNRWTFVDEDGDFTAVNNSIDAMEDSLCHRDAPEFRCTRPDLYTANCAGRDDQRARQGHYIRAPDAEMARRIMQKQYPGERIDVELWKK